MAIIERYIGVQPFSFFELMPFLLVQNKYIGDVSEIILGERFWDCLSCNDIGA